MEYAINTYDIATVTLSERQLSLIATALSEKDYNLTKSINHHEEVTGEVSLYRGILKEIKALKKQMQNARRDAISFDPERNRRDMEAAGEFPIA